MTTKLNDLSNDLLSINQQKLAGVLCNWQGLIQKHFHENVEAQTIMFFLLVASKDQSIDLTYIGQTLNLSKAATSRNYYRLADGRTGSDGLGLVMSLVDYNDRRRMLVTLTPKGVAVAKELIDFIQ